jgi:hypothetical protein
MKLSSTTPLDDSVWPKSNNLGTAAQPVAGADLAVENPLEACVAFAALQASLVTLWQPQGGSAPPLGRNG